MAWRSARSGAVVAAAALCTAAVLVGVRLSSPAKTSTSTPQTAPADPLAGQAARNELDRLTALPARLSGPRLLSGYFGGYGSGFDAHSWSVGGRLPGLIGCDYADVPSSGPPTVDTSCNAQLIAYAAAGGLVTVSVHGPSPDGAGLGIPLSPVQFAQLNQPGTAIGRTWDTQLDELAAGLRQLSAAGVPVLFRPLLEMNGGAFWWDGQSGAAFRAVWQNMFAYVNARLGPEHEVLWVWSAGCERTGPDQAGEIEGYYPGSAYVDVVGADCYTNDPAGAAPGQEDVGRTYQDLSGFAQAQGKPFAFTELGGDDADNEAASHVDFAAWIGALHGRFPLAAYFQAWNGPVGPTGSNNRNGADLLTDPGVINQGGLAGQGPAVTPAAAPSG